MSATASPLSSASIAGALCQGAGIAILWVNPQDLDGRAAARAVDRLVRSTIRSRRTTAEFNRLHDRLLAADGETRAGLEEGIVTLLRSDLVAQLRGWCGPCSDRDDLIAMAVNDALRKYVEQPRRYVSGRGEAIAWFVKVAQRKLLDALRAQRRRLGLERPAGVDADLERIVPNTALLPNDAAEARDAHTAELVERLMPFAWTDGEKKYLRVKFCGGLIPEQAAALGLRRLASAEQQKHLNRAWNRIKHRATRSAVLPRTRRSRPQTET